MPDPAFGHSPAGALKVGYARVSSDDQNLDLQLHALGHEGCDRIFEEKGSGAARDRTAFRQALGSCRSGDTLVVWKLDRLGRSLAGLVEVADTLRARGIGLKVLTGYGATIDTATSEGRMLFGILATLAEFERELIRERTRAGMSAAKRRGVRLGRPAKLSSADIHNALKLMAGGLTRADAAASLGVCARTLDRSIRRSGSEARTFHDRDERDGPSGALDGTMEVAGAPGRT